MYNINIPSITVVDILNSLFLVLPPLIDSLEFVNAQADGPGLELTNYGQQRTILANKVDPRYNSVLDHRDPRESSSSYNPHSSNTDTKMDPCYDSNPYHRGATEGSTNYGPDRTNVSQRMSPHYGSDVDYHREDYDHGTATGSTNHEPHSADMGNKLNPPYKSDLAYRGTKEVSTRYGSHSMGVGNELDQRYDSNLDHRGRWSSLQYEDRQISDGDIGTSDFNRAAREFMESSTRNHARGVKPPRASDQDQTEKCGQLYGQGISALPHADEDQQDRYDESYQKPYRNNMLNRLDPRLDNKTGMRRY